MALHLEVQDGVATATRGLAIQTRAINIIGTGTLDLDTEALKLNFRTAQRKGIGISASGLFNHFIKVGGTVRNPKMQASPASAVTRTGAAIFTGGISLLAEGAWKRLSAEKDPCGRIREQLARDEQPQASGE